ncbi:4-hydroxy-tetrahydrodipicolinate synthase [Silvibacterium sp.]|uniref:4-hydroxy-tetrahydrodipicolinate synthase n=1 Tax=Silvibacterium sp. TaxID=1964179 RepID=UPI0039E42179
MDAPTGCGTALVTPFRADGSLDEPTLYNLAQWQVESGIDWLVACGTTAETPTLTDEEWLRVIRIITEAVAGRIPVWAGATHNSTREAAQRAALAAKIPGVTAILTANPYYNKPNQEGQFQHFRAVAQATAQVSDLPVVLYNIPGRTGTNLEPATVLRLIDAEPNIAGVKESSGSLPQITELLTLVPRSFHVYAGDDNMALGTIALGGAGLVSVASNQIPTDMTAMMHAALANDWTTARRLNRKYFRLLQANFWETSPGPVKAVMAMMGKLEEHYRLPIVPVAPSTRAKLERIAGELGLLVHGPQPEGDLGLF